MTCVFLSDNVKYKTSIFGTRRPSLEPYIQATSICGKPGMWHAIIYSQPQAFLFKGDRVGGRVAKIVT